MYKVWEALGIVFIRLGGLMLPNNCIYKVWEGLGSGSIIFTSFGEARLSIHCVYKVLEPKAPKPYKCNAFGALRPPKIL
jgi:multidrug transporter EmrE-like cation transporter